MPDLPQHPLTPPPPIPTSAAEPAQRPSKSQRKRDATALQKLAETLVQAPPKQRHLLPLPEPLVLAIAAAATMQKSAYRRHIRHIAGLLRKIDVSTVNASLEHLHGSGAAQAAVHKRTEHWCAQLIEHGDTAIAALIADHPEVDRSQLYQLTRNARRAAHPVKAARLLYRFVRTLAAD